MKRLLSNRWFRLSAGLCSVLLVALLSCAWYYDVWSWRDLQIYTLMSRECHPVWRDLHEGRVRVGQDVEEVIATTKPVRVERFGEYVCIDYQEWRHFTGVTILAKSGRLLSGSAWSCTWDRVFFDESTDADWRTFFAARQEYLESLLKKRAEAEPGDRQDRPED